jgi:transcription antitermination factor NusG
MQKTPYEEALVARLQQKKAQLVALEGFGLGTRVAVTGGPFAGRTGAVTRLTTMAGYRYVTFDRRPRERTEKRYLVALAQLQVLP